MKKFLLLMLACLFVFQYADAQKTRRKHVKYKKHNEKPTYYYNKDGTLSDKPLSADASRPSPYQGDKVRENDGPKKNEHRNINTNSSQPLPSSSGK